MHVKIPNTVLYLLMWYLFFFLGLSLFLKILYYFRVLGSQQNSTERTEIPTHPRPPYMHSLPHYQHPTPDGTLITTDEPT